MAVTQQKSRLSFLGDLIMIPLALASVGILIWELTVPLSPQKHALLNHIDLVIACIFLLEFVIRFALAPKKIAFLKSNWWYLLASIPISTPATQALRALRLLRLLRLYRVITGTRSFFTSTGLVYVGTLLLVIVIAGAAAFELFELGTNPNIHGFGDSLWWALTTVTTVAYGDIYPVTSAGRIVASILMIGGIGIQGTFIALLSSYLTKDKKS